MTCLAVVGSTAFAGDVAATREARRYIEEAIESLEPGLVVSGGAVGIDRLAVEVAQGYGIPVRERLPEHARWAPGGYKERNLLIARDCTHLLCLSHVGSKTYGSGWTADQAARLGKKVERYTLGRWEP